MAITKKDVEHVAKLSRLNFSDSEIESFQKDLNDIVGYIDLLQKVDTKNVSDLSREIGEMREDKISQSIPQAEILKNCAHQDGASFVVQKVVE